MGISRKQALDCLASDDLIGIGMEADAVRRRLHPEGVVGYLMRAPVELADADAASIERKVAAALEFGASAVALRGASGLAAFEAVVARIRRSVPALWIEGPPAEELRALCAGSDVGLEEALGRLRDAGLDGIGAEVEGGAWLAVHRAAHALGMKTTVAMTFGAGETLERRVSGLESVRELQEETGGVAAFLPRSFVPAHRELDGTTAVEALKTLAVARMVLDGIDNLEVSGSLKVMQMGLRFGGNDAGAVAPGAYTRVTSNSATEEELRRIIRDAGFRPVERDAAYRTCFLG